MRKLGWSGLIIGLLLVVVVPVGAAPLASGAVGIASTAVCKDTATIAASGTATYATNRVKVRLYKQNPDGSFDWLRSANSENFGSGDFLLALTLDYSANQVAAGRVIRVDVILQRLSGGSFVDDALVSSTVTAADQSCKDKCSITVSTSDRAPVNGTLTLRTHFGAWFRPEGRLYGAMPINAGTPAHFTVVGVPCGAAARVWFYPATGKDRTPKMLPAQYWPDEFAASGYDGAIPYATAFVRGIAATKPLESDDAYAPK